MPPMDGPNDGARAPVCGAMIPTLISVSDTPGSFVHGLGSATFFRSANWPAAAVVVSDEPDPPAVVSFLSSLFEHPAASSTTARPTTTADLPRRPTICSPCHDP